MKKLSIVIPVFNERATIEEIVRRVKAAPCLGLEKEIVVVDDCSTDGTSDILRGWRSDPSLRIVFKSKNHGKGAALRDGFQCSTGDLVLVQDADLEYDPNEYPHLLQPIVDGLADVVYGSRFLGGPHRVLYFWHSLGNRLLTLLSNATTNLNLSDMETCYKVFRGDVIRKITIESDRFGFEPEVTAKVAQLGCRIYEVQISYSGRTYAEGKKIGWKDGVNALYCIARFGVVDRLLRAHAIERYQPTPSRVAVAADEPPPKEKILSRSSP